MLALIDADIIAWRTATSTEDWQEATKRAEDLIDNILSTVKATEYRLILSSDTNFRKDINKEYKADRPPTPEAVKQMKGYLLEHCNAELSPDGLEADDMMAILQTNDTVICTIDKDLLQVDGWHYQWELRGTSVNGNEWVKEARFFEQSELEGTRLLYEQFLKGDKTDNVSGVRGLGKAKATKLLAHCTSEKEMLDICLEQYNNEVDFLLNAQCLYIIRDYDDNYLKRYERLK